MTLITKVAMFARTPQGRRLIAKATGYAQSPEGRRRIAQVREQIAARGGTHGARKRGDERRDAP